MRKEGEGQRGAEEEGSMKDPENPARASHAGGGRTTGGGRHLEGSLVIRVNMEREREEVPCCNDMQNMNMTWSDMKNEVLYVVLPGPSSIVD